MENLLVKMSFGSHVYGTDTPNSDLDFKGIFMNSLPEIVLGTGAKNVQLNTNTAATKNTKDDVDFEMIELRKFIRDAIAGQTYAFDMLFTPTDFYVDRHKDPVMYNKWMGVVNNRGKFLSKNVKPFIGYCIKQANKYGIKGGRLDAIEELLKVLRASNPKDKLEVLKDTIVPNDFVYFYPQELKNAQGEMYYETYLFALGKKFSFNVFIKEVLESISKLREIYGARAELAMENEGVDWKAVSHAYRCCYQLKQLGEIGSIAFPLKDHRQYLLQVKTGQIPYSQIQDELPVLMETATKAVLTSSFLPEEPDYAFWEQYILDAYLPSEEPPVYTY